MPERLDLPIKLSASARGLTGLILSMLLLAACSSGPGASLSQAQFAGILPGSKGDRNGILPGSKGDRNGILPGSKGDRNQLAALEVQLRLPRTDGFSVAQLSQIPSWQAELDGVKAVGLHLTRQELVGQDQLLSFRLEQLEPLADADLHELVFSLDGVVQTASLLPAFTPGQTKLSAPLDVLSLAEWLIMRELQHQKDQSLQQLDPSTLAILRAGPDSAALAAQLDALYRKSKGKTDPIKASEAETRASAAKLKVRESQKSAAQPPASAKPSSEPNGKPASPAETKPGAETKPDTVPQPDKPTKAPSELPSKGRAVPQ